MYCIVKYRSTGLGRGIFRSPPELTARSIAVSADGKTMYLGTSAGLYKSTTGGL